MNNIDKLVDLEKKIQYKFQNFGLLEMAMRHSSYANEHHMERLECNERLEFLGDAVLEVVSSEFLYKTFPRLPEGEMTKKRASLVCEPALAFCAREIDLGSFLLLGKGEEATGGRHRDEEIVYTILKEEGPDHDKSFWAQVSVGKKALGTGKGRTKKAAEQAAAYDAILARKKA